MRLMIDLYAGLGGASQAFVNDPKWDVLQFDNNPALLEENPNLIMIDLENKFNIYNYLMMIKFGDYDQVVIWSSPPCLEFSMGYNAPGPKAAREGRPFYPNLTHMLNSQWIIEIIDSIHPNVIWVIENVMGAKKHFLEHLGKPRQISNAWVLWGNFEQLHIPEIEKTNKTALFPSPLRANLRAKVPAEISQALKDYALTQRKITDYFRL